MYEVLKSDGTTTLHFSVYILPYGGVAHLGERLPCKQEVAGSSPAGSTKEEFSIGSSRLFIIDIIKVKNQFRFGLITIFFPPYITKRKR